MTRTWHTPSGDIYDLFTAALAAPHIMIAGATGSGKSVALNGIISTALYRAPGAQKGGAYFIFIDNGKGTELIQYSRLPHCLRYAHTREESAEALRYALQLAQNRFRDMRRRGLRDYDGGDIYVCIDEFASLILNDKKNVPLLVQDLAQLGRAAKVHIILCTQCPTADVIPTRIKVNFDTRIALRTANKQQSRNIMDANGCEELPNPRTDGRAEGYYCDGADRTHYIMPYVTEDEINRLIAHWTSQTGLFGRKPGRKPGLLRRLFGAA